MRSVFFGCEQIGAEIAIRLLIGIFRSGIGVGKGLLRAARRERLRSAALAEGIQRGKMLLLTACQRRE